MIFITVGSQKFQFDRLLKKVDELIELGVINEEVFAQIGYSTYLPQHYKYKDFLNREEFADYIDRTEIVLTHGGTGVIINAVKKGKRVIAVPRKAEFAEHVDDHQVQLLDQFGGMNLISVCYEIDELDKCVNEIRTKQFNSYVSNTETIISEIEAFILGAVNK